MAEAGNEDLKAAGVEEIIVAPEGQEDVLGGDDAAAAFAQELENIGLEARDEGPRVSDQSVPGAAGRVLQWSCQEWSSEGRGSAPEDGTKASERSFSGANWL